jgi:hypothetical protein
VGGGCGLQCLSEASNDAVRWNNPSDGRDRLMMAAVQLDVPDGDEKLMSATVVL